jgi:hypothetical protein
VGSGLARWQRPFWDVTINIAVGGDDSGIEPSGEMAFDTINAIVGRIRAANHRDGVKPDRHRKLHQLDLTSTFAFLPDFCVELARARRTRYMPILLG